MHDKSDRTPQPTHRDIVSTWGIAALVILALFGVSKVNTVIQDPGASDVFIAAGQDGTPLPYYVAPTTPR